MMPATAVATVVARTALPVFASIADPRALVAAFAWSTRTIGLLLLPIELAVFFAADDLILVVGGEQWPDAARGMRILCWAALARALTALFPQLFHAIGKPSFAIYESVLNLVLLSFGMLLLLGGLPELGIRAVCYAWLATYPLALLVDWALARSLLPLGLTQYLRALSASGLCLLLVGGTLLLLRPLMELAPAGFARIALIAFAVSSVYLVFLRTLLKVKVKDLFFRGDAAP
jgi:O-antigen/teichoic acid export membrane protein